MKTIGFVGTGIMGGGMVRTLIRSGYSPVVYNRTRVKAEEAAKGGGSVVDTPAEAAAGAEVLFTMLADPAAVAACFEGADGILSQLASGTVVIDSSTISQPVTLKIAEQVGAKGAQFLDAPVTGSKNEAESGKLGFLVGGDAEVLESVRDVLECLGSITHMGATGMGVCTKLVNNLVVAGSLQAFNEGMVLAARAGLDPDRMYSVLMGNPRARCGITEWKGSTILQRDFTPFFALKLMGKDVRLALETAEQLGVDLPSARALKTVYDACLAEGLAEEDFSASVKHLERAARVEVKSRNTP